MNPIVVIAGFIVLLAILIYYLQSRRSEPEKVSTVEKPNERNVVKVKDYKAEQEKEQPSEEPVKVEPIPEPVIEESEIDDIAMLAGIGPKYQELLRAVGYKSIKLIAESSPENLHALLIKTNEVTGITKRPPTLRNVEDWINSARSH